MPVNAIETAYVADYAIRHCMAGQQGCKWTDSHIPVQSGQEPGSGAFTAVLQLNH